MRPCSTSWKTRPTLGGTVGYMSPEHLEALADGRTDGVDARSDVYALGVVLYEAMGERPFGAPTPSRSVREVLLRAAEDRRARPPDLRRAFPETPPALAAVVAKCLAPDPDDRYASAADLAIDLQAVADDAPLVFAREPLDERVVGWMRRHRKALSVTTLIVLALGFSASLYIKDRFDQLKRHGEIMTLLHEAEDSVHLNNYDLGLEQFATVELLAGDSSDLAALKRKARLQKKVAIQARDERGRADRFFEKADDLRFHLLGYEGDPKRNPIQEADEALSPFYVLTNPNWTERDELTRLDRDRRERLIRDVTELLFLQACACAASSGRPSQELAISRSDTALAFIKGEDRRPWRAVRAIAAAKLAGTPLPELKFPDPTTIHDAWQCYQWGRICLLPDVRDTSHAVQWLERATRYDSRRFWLEFDAAYQEDWLQAIDLALSHYTAALKIRPNYPRALFNRGRLLARRGAWDRAAEDLDRALQAAREAKALGTPAVSEIDEIQVERGLVLQNMGNLAAADRAYRSVLTPTTNERLRRAALSNLAKLNFDRGHIVEAQDNLDQLIAIDPGDLTARLGRATLMLRMKRPIDAESDLNFLLERTPNNADALAYRARASLALNRPDSALKDAELALRIEPTPRHDRLRSRILLAMGKLDGVRLDDPDEIRLFPGGSARLAADLRSAVSAENGAYATPAKRSSRAVILAALDDPEALDEAVNAVKGDPRSTRTGSSWPASSWVAGTTRRPCRRSLAPRKSSPTTPASRSSAAGS